MTPNEAKADEEKLIATCLSYSKIINSTQRVSPSPQQLVAWLRSTELNSDESCIGGGGSFVGTGLVSPDIGGSTNLTRTRMDNDCLTSWHLNQSRLPFKQDLELRPESTDGKSNEYVRNSPRVVSSHCFVRALERSQQSQDKLHRFQSDDSERNSFNAALLTTRSRRILLDSAPWFGWTACDIVQIDPPPNHLGHGEGANNVAIGEDEDSHASLRLSQADPEYMFDENHRYRQRQYQNSSTVGDHADSWTMVDDETSAMTTTDAYTREKKKRCISAHSTGDLYPEDAVRAELLRISREQLKWEEARLGL